VTSKWKRLPRRLFVGIWAGSGLLALSTWAGIFAQRGQDTAVALVMGGTLTVALMASAWLLTRAIRRREHAADLLAEANRRLRDAQRIGRIGDWQFDIREQVATWSEQLCLMYGRDPADSRVTRDEASRYIDAETLKAIQAASERAIGLRRTDQADYPVQFADGRFAYHRLLVSPVFDEAGELIELKGTEQDVTAEKLAEKLVAKTAHLGRLELVNTMAATIAHELSQPLTAATNLLALVSWSLKSDEPVDRTALQESVSLASRQLDLAADIIRRTRDIVAGRRNPNEEALLDEIVTDAFALARASAGGGKVALVQKICPPDLGVAADRVQVLQVLLNLLRNATDATQDIAGAVVRVIGQSDGDRVLVCVEDNGPGFPQATTDSFRAFETSKDEGLGLGLSISRAIVQGYGGEMWIGDCAGGGAAVWFSLPCSRPPAGG
jgi:two-component system sensor kinase FixL